MIWHGEWADPELECDGYVANYYDVENYLYENAKDDGIDVENDDVFAEYVREHADDAKWMISEYGEKQIDSGCHSKKKKGKKSVKSAMDNTAWYHREPKRLGKWQVVYMEDGKEKYQFNLNSKEECIDWINDNGFTLDTSMIESAMPGREKSIRAIMDEYGCSWEEAEEIMNEEIASSKKPVKSSFAGFDDFDSFVSYAERHYLPLLDKVSEEGYQITREDARLLAFLHDDIVSLVNDKQ
jgi:hypothetical protein